LLVDKKNEENSGIATNMMINSPIKNNVQENKKTV